jgi:hypothetical protein
LRSFGVEDVQRARLIIHRDGFSGLFDYFARYGGKGLPIALAPVAAEVVETVLQGQPQEGQHQLVAEVDNPRRRAEVDNAGHGRDY